VRGREEESLMEGEGEVGGGRQTGWGDLAGCFAPEGASHAPGQHPHSVQRHPQRLLPRPHVSLRKKNHGFKD